MNIQSSLPQVYADGDNGYYGRLFLRIPQGQFRRFCKDCLREFCDSTSNPKLKILAVWWLHMKL